jgi:uncharacterized membrane protein YdfJ with MMPL/SSD domain
MHPRIKWRVIHTHRYTFGRIILKYPIVPLLIVVGLTVPLAIHAMTFPRGVGNINIAPRNAASTLAYESIQRLFSPGRCVCMYVCV